MKMIEKKYYYSIEDFFPSSIIAGFTKTNLDGRQVEKDIRNALSDFGVKHIRVAFMNQRHSCNVNFIDRQGQYEGDALFTKERNVVLVVKTADCLPLFFYDNKTDCVGIVHLGWRSAKEGILDNINIDFSSCLALAGVALRKCCFKVTDEFLGYRRLAPFVKKENNNLYYDPITFSKITLAGKGLENSNFRDLDICTFCHSDNFFSYRRDKTKNRVLSFIVKK